MVCFAGPVLAGGHSGPRALALDLAAVAAVSPDWHFVRGDICAAASDSASPCACSWASGQLSPTRALAAQTAWEALGELPMISARDGLALLREGNRRFVS